MTLEKQTTTPGLPGRTTVPSAPHDLRVDGRPPREDGDGARGVNLTSRPRPRLSWRTPDDEAQQRTGYEVTVADEAGTTIWASGAVASTETAVTVDAPLEEGGLYAWQVRTRTEHGWSGWSRAELETGPHGLDRFGGSWIGVAAGTRVRQPFDVTGEIERARLHVTAQGLVRAELGGVAVNDGHLDATRTDAVRALYRTYDVTDLIAAGENVLDLVAGTGEWERSGLPPRVLASLVLRHRDGTTQIVHPGAGSLVSPSRIVVDEPFYLERHDPSADRGTSWTPVDPTSLVSPDAQSTGAGAPPARIEPDSTPPVRVVARLHPTELSRGGGVRLYDVGVNIAGRSRVEVGDALAAGSVIRVVHGEHVDAAGRLDTTNLTMPFDNGRVRQVMEWVASGEPGDVVEPWFAYYGFRYIEVHGLPDDARAEVVAETLHTDLQPAGAIEVSNPTVGRLLERAARTLLNNVHGVPEDCPTREQAAWTGDTASVAEYELAAFDSEAFLAKWLRDLMTSQEPDGSFPAIAPDVREPRMPADPVWGSAFHRLLLGHWLHYGDESLVREALPALRRWADFQVACTDGHGVIGLSPISYGHDWLALEQTPPPVHHTGAVIDCLLTLARLEAELGDDASSGERLDQVEQLRAAARRRFHDPERGVFANGSQGAWAVAIEAGILTGADADEAGRRIERDVRDRGNRISGGFATTRSIVRALAATGRSQVVMDMLEQPAEPGIGAMLAGGPGTFWECWWIDPANTGTGSLDHVGLGGVFAGWAWESLAGLRPTSAGYRTFTLEPQFVSGVDDLAVRTATPRGTIGMSYRFTGTTVSLTVEVPPGTVGTVALPGQAPRELAPGQHTLTVALERVGAVDPAPDAEPWAAPALAPRAADVTGPDDLLRRAVDRGALTAPGSELAVLDRLVCMPIPHAQPLGPIAQVLPVDGSRPVARVDFDEPVDASDATFAFALVDLCDERSARGALPTLRLIAADDSDLLAVGETWPAGWNRVAADLGDWPGRSAIVAAEVSLRFPEHGGDDQLMPQSADDAPGGFHFGGLGLSTARRTW
ncbi:family 78 glycoside hydrolase catalytic domain [Leifsonia naganoensis]|uniref:alpha-L-rhamnosidase n=1 Tax=Leifsonia naganoensis TaxID=150025 RepID=A0A853DJM9_9MICO|nr:family 78 glycoside hydrolase catalytic domain [Leifsonia naganoensis]NYK09286.1 alpha-L-rhamnosidase [Leifsonia naganoensis]